MKPLRNVKERKPAARSNGKHHLALLLLLVSLPLYATAQKLTGTVCDSSGRPLRGVSVMLKSSKGNVKAYAITAAGGTFMIKMPTSIQSTDSIEFRNMGYGKVSLPVGRYRNGQTVTMDVTAFVLKEVKVKPPKISLRGDTLNYAVSSFRRESDRSIADVIKRMPGLNVGEDGHITYQGKSINKFYIEGMDLMGGKYATASENLDAIKVKTVQVLERHQPVRALQDVTFSDQAALNIVLEDSVKNVWQGEMAVQAGAAVQDEDDFLYGGRALAMLFSRKMQSISMYKCDNTGKDISREVKPLVSPDGFVPTEYGLLSNIGIGGTGLQKNRTMFNDTHIAATNWLLRTRGDNDLRMQLTALFDKSLQRQDSYTTYTNIGNTAIVTESYDARSYDSDIDGELMYKINKDSFYLVNTVNGHASFAHSNGTTMLDSKETRRSVRPHKWYITDYTSLIHNLRGGRSLSATSSAAYSSLPGTLLLHDGTHERLDISTFTWNAATKFGHRLWLMHIDYTAGFDMKRQTLDIANPINTATENYDEYRIYIAPSASYQCKRLRFGLNAPLSWRYRRLNGQRRSILTVEPSAYVSVKPTARWDIYASYMYSWQPQDALTSGAAAVFTDYRTVRQGTGTLDYTAAHTMSLSANYKDVIHGFFANGGLSYAHSGNNTVYRADLNEGVYRTIPTGLRSGTSTLTLRGNASKSFDWAGLYLSLAATASRHNYKLLTDNTLTPCRSTSDNVNLTVGVRPADWISADLSSSLNANHQTSRSTDGDRSADMLYLHHTLNTYITQGKWLLAWSNELYHSNDRSVTSSFFSDLSVSYKARTYEIRLDVNNIFGRSTFERRWLTDTEHIVTVSRLRPRELLLGLRFGF